MALSKLLMMSSGISVKRLANTEAKNRVEYSQLSIQLNRIEKEKQSELKMLNNEKTRFMAKYTRANLSSVSSQTSEIKMYETHTPGFCFKRNGEQRLAQQMSATPSIDFNHFHFLLFTNGEVDIEKVLCLHLLSSHETKHLSPPKLFHTSSSFMKRDSPLEQLIERSKDHQVESDSCHLPTYILDVNKQSDGLKDDERLMSRLIVNEKLLELVTTVMRALEQSNPEKVQEMLRIASDPGHLKRIFTKPHIQEFVSLLKDNSLVNSCSSFVLTHPTREEPNHIEIRTSTGALEDLVRFIRSNVLQFPKHVGGTLGSASRGVLTAATDDTKLKAIDPRRITSPRHKTRLQRRPSTAVEEEEEEELEEEVVPIKEVNPFRHVVKNFVAENIAAAGRRARREEEAVRKPKRPNIESRRSAGAAAGGGVARTSLVSGESRKSRRPSDTIPSHVRVHSKQTTCPACMEKWRIPLPTPKVSKMPKADTSNLQQRISMLIDREQFKLDTYERKYSNVSSSSGLNSYGGRRSDVSSDSTDQMDLNLFDLERIRQEIREKETKKKLERFLGD